MAEVKVVSMNSGDDECSYANNSKVQNTLVMKSLAYVEETLMDLATSGFPECLKLVDLGCASGPNTLLVVTEMVKIVGKICQKKNFAVPEIELFLNDLPDNDFNTTFQMVPQIFSELENGEGIKYGNFFVFGVPGSFYRRLFPSKSMHLVHSSCSLHWLSQVPEKLGNNKGNIYISKTSPPGVSEAYAEQYRTDFSKFLRLRSEEVVPGGRMVLTLAARSISDPTSKEFCCKWELLAKALQDMSDEGLVQNEDIDSFNLPFYTPCAEEVKDIVQYEGSFSLDRFESHELVWKDNENIFTKSVRAVMEPMLANHFGTKSFMDKLFQRYEMHVADHLSEEKIKSFYILISLTRKFV
ncbi:hypothetical protein DCAR_0934041 [Daucus carota subsp. sativus]|uniref:Uncharacterized protein n=1 Tax=Daucus carota subsp. sativus TaxID=79200 RepID=A0AAF0XW87_DAUCS|nr:PREDICTED: benzoate carboxyl methyltransferase-like [Daucus carota subsp. sativus]WOH14522.1 hypothetical protein DCAR_0934041 [Daucus carota subsp. sativus]